MLGKHDEMKQGLQVWNYLEGMCNSYPHIPFIFESHSSIESTPVKQWALRFPAKEFCLS